LERLSTQNKDPVVELAKEFGLNDEQIKAMNGMGSFMPPSVIRRFRNKSPQQIAEAVQRYAPVFIASTQIFTEALGNPEQLIEIDRQRIADLIAEKENYSNPLLAPQLRHATEVRRSRTTVPEDRHHNC
jgi:hypothetical protein